VQAHGTMKWSLSGVSRQSLERLYEKGTWGGISLL
jgi:hypothetical protein